METAEEARAQARLRAARQAIRTGTPLMVLEHLPQLLQETMYARALSIRQTATQMGIYRSVISDFLAQKHKVHYTTVLAILHWIQYGDSRKEQGKQ